MKLWIDDVRPAPEGYIWCKSTLNALHTIYHNADDIEEIAECVVVGRKKEDSEEVVLTAVVYPDFNKYEKNTEISEIASDIKSKVMALNKKLPSFKQIHKVEFRDTEFEKTTTRKIRRNLVK
jgi:long-chain acyl-CoA synthetase